MKFILTVAVCLFLALSISAQTEDTNGSAEKEQAVEKISLGRKDKDGNIEEGVEVFAPKNIPIYCYIDLTSGQPTLVKMKIVAVKAKDLRPGTQIVAVQYQTKDGENGVTFNASPGNSWAAGEYRVEVFLDGKPSVTKDFRVVE
jgi:hypothetical protein